MFKTVFRLGTLTVLGAGVLAGGALLIAGPHRTKAVFHKVQDNIKERLDQCIDDPSALRAQLQELEREYPERIAQVRGDLAELNQQIRQLEKDQAIARRVVAMADEDLGLLEQKVAAAGHAADGNGRAAMVSFDRKIYSYERAAAKLNQIRHTRIAYGNRAADDEHDLAYLHQQAQRLEELLLQLENERAQFQSQIWGLSRQVDAIARNERLIDLLEKRNRTIEECSRYDVTSLEQLTARLSEVRSRQEAELDVLANSRYESDYEDMARVQLQGEASGGAAAAPERGIAQRRPEPAIGN